ncbi:uncharacterized protein LOC113760098 [Coffea eugenioides]|uniref:uncharacterized protein LOC113760098 n=1 Tax=Coffea eugenioides TaxID=49369 RepID=UPI000F6107E2|nr:uncharacterized protein LOC113760098 [Coffea eugenioides]
MSWGRVRLKFSACPLAWGCPTKVKCCLIPRFSHHALKGLSANCFSLSEMMTRGSPKLYCSFLNARDLDVQLLVLSLSRGDIWLVFLSATARLVGPGVVGLFGLLQPLADGLKLILKEPISPSSANFSLLRMAPVTTFMLSLVAWAVVPFDYGMVLSDPNIGLLYLFTIFSLGVYGIIIAGWSSN